ncbi:MAG TPA: GNAT family N-acetyltransferase [Sphingobium sp.]|uniref:GNAT family N-acetyltransferase n=1 Tax=Sphingobium sp. TaxID=1912891 RepID=UPI002ED33BAF
MDQPTILLPATDADVPAVVALMNMAYRGRGAEAGWTTEAGYIAGTRITEDLLRQDLAAKPDAAMLLCYGADGVLLGCVWLEPEPDDVWYLGSLTVMPGVQNAGLGRRILAAAEDWAAARGAREIRMSVVHLRDTLIAWYVRRGYRVGEETARFPYGDERFGTPLRDDLHFIILRKRLMD